MALISDFMAKVQAIHATGEATEHSYRSAIEFLFSGLDENTTALNEPKRVKCGAPDFIINQGDIVIGHVEAKDLHIGLRGMKDANKDQQNRYRKALSNLIYTNCLDWDFYRDGELYASVTIADKVMGIQPSPDKYEELENLLRNYIAQRPQTITSPKNLAERMAGKAVLIKDVLQNALKEDENLQTELAGQYRAFKEHLIHDITATDFADIYAETIAYGMFAARLHDQTLDTFDRQEALELLPKSNPFLRSLFGYIAGHDLDERIKWIIDDLARVFRAADVAKLMENFGKLTGQNDPFLHFYETFLAAYNPAKRKARGVWYTPEPVVNFIVRAVDDVLQTEFGLPDGLADTSKVTIPWDTGQTDKKGKPVMIKKEVHRVQVLDPATGTGTFLAEVIKQIAPKVKDVAEGMWSPYIEKDLIPRLHGFELLMASYAMCHMKLDMMLTELGYKPTGTPPRLGVYLTNSLEEGEPANQTLPFAQWLSNEVKEANTVKRDMPIMCIVGNPPYSGISTNKGAWITGLIDDYKYVDGVHFGERKHWLNDDYVKFIRMSENLIEKNGEGVLGFITNHGYLDNPTFRGMRWHLMQTFDKIYVLDLHGNANKKEVTPEGKPDKNVFDIRQGVSIILGVKLANSAPGNARVFHKELWGNRAGKYAELQVAKIGTDDSLELSPAAPYFMFYDVNLSVLENYDTGFSLQEFAASHCTGIISARDELVVDTSKSELERRLQRFLDASRTVSQTRAEFFGSKKAGKYLKGDSRGWKLDEKREILQQKDVLAAIQPIQYRPLDNRWICYDPDIVDWPRQEVLAHFNDGKNIALLSPRMTADEYSPLVSETIISNKTGSRYDQTYFFPLYLYPDEQDLDQTRRVNFDPKLWKQLQAKAKHPTHGIPDEIQTFDYIYGVLHCPAYRETYAEFLKIDFPRIPWPARPDAFWDISEKGSALRKLHLMDPAAVGKAPFPFKGEGEGMVDKPELKDGRVWINETQYFEDIPPVSWEFYIGGYQPAQKWLKDRRGRALSFDDVKHYQSILKILSETDRIMQTIEMEFEA
ncbi:type ISP restriction/modification enzyme [Sulfitobacter sp.]|uniref:type ISP restriction/modification enzyme n=1 Tax=Sulfitobacter sp. TaxID=1903071 RepID=UPI0030026ED9